MYKRRFKKPLYKRRSTKRGYQKKYSTGRTMGSKVNYALRLAKKNAKSIEVKYNDNQSQVLAMSSGKGKIIVAKDIVRGTTINARVGDKITIKKVLLKLGIVKDASDTSNGGIMRIVIVRNTKPEIAQTCGWTTLFERDAIMSLPKRNQPGRFEFLYDKESKLDWSTGSQVYKTIVLRINKDTTYDSTELQLETNLIEGAIRILVWIIGTTETPAVYYDMRTTYTDQ